MHRSYVAAAYVKWIEQAGGRAVPIRCARLQLVGSPQLAPKDSPQMSKVNFALCRYYSSDAELVRLFKSVNGLILPVRTPLSAVQWCPW